MITTIFSAFKKQTSHLMFSILFVILGTVSTQSQNQTPLINSFSPTNGYIGSLITLTGSNLGSATSVTFGGVPGIIISNTESALVAMVMPGSNTGNISVETPGGAFNTSNGFEIIDNVYSPVKKKGAKLIGTGISGSGAYQGCSVAISADGKTAVVGANEDGLYFSESTNKHFGAAWVYVKSNNGNWVQQGNKLTKNDDLSGGYNPSAKMTVGISADGNTIIMSNPNDNGSKGAIWVFERSDGVWSQQGSKLTANKKYENGYAFGTALSISPNGETLAVSDFSNNIFIYKKENGTWVEQASAPQIINNETDIPSSVHFVTLALSADGNTIIAGLPHASYETGAVWIFSYQNGTWVNEAERLTGTGNIGASAQGSSVSLSADGNIAAVGGTWDNGSIGATWIFTKTNGVWSQFGSKLVASDYTNSANQGISVSLSADGNQLIVGGPSDNNGEGSAWVYKKKDNTWVVIKKLIGTNGARALHGTSVAISADGTTALVGAPNYVYYSAPNTIYSGSSIIYTQDITPPSPNVANLPIISGGKCVSEYLIMNNPPTATDDVSGLIIGQTVDPLFYDQIGDHIITWKYDDGNGNVTTQTQTIRVTGQTSAIPIPDLTSLPDIISQCSINVETKPTAKLNCETTILGSTTDPLSYSQQGEYLITWNYTNGEGNTTSQVQKVIIKDNLAPVPSLDELPKIIYNVSVGGVLEILIPTAIDACNGEIIGTTEIDIDALMADPLTYGGSVYITWNYDDGFGNISQQIQIIEITDDIAPIPNTPELETHTSTCSFSDLEIPSAFDNYLGEIYAEADIDYYSIWEPGTYTITWTFDDYFGNIVTQNQTVILENKPPTPIIANLPKIITATPEETFANITIPKAVDDCNGILEATTDFDFNASIEPGTYTIVWNYFDGNEEIISQEQEIIVVGSETNWINPDIETLPIVESECAVEITEIPTATDLYGNKIFGTTTDPLIFTENGDYLITWVYDDENGNTITQEQTVIINDITSPVPDLENLPTITEECAIGNIIPPTATDNCTGIIQGFPDIELSSITNQGEYTITWTFDDLHGNLSKQTQIIIIKDNTPPVPDVENLSVIEAECMAEDIEYPTATDNCAGQIIGVPDQDLTSFTEQGEYTITWTFDDGNGNINYQEQKVIIKDNTPPIPDATTLADIKSDCGISAENITVPTATDNCSDIVTVTSNIPTEGFTGQGNYMITWTFDDGNGNTSTQLQQVIIKDELPPTLVGILPGNNEGQCMSNMPLAPNSDEIAAQYIDNCSDVTASLTNTTTEGDDINGWTVTYTYTIADANGNSTIADITFTGRDNNAPVAITQDIEIELDASGMATINANQIDNGSYDECNDIISRELDITNFDCSNLGLNIVTLTIVDAAGNQSTAEAVVSVYDNILPTITAPSDLNIYNTPGENGALNIELGIPDVSDNCSIDNVTNDAPTIFPIGTTIVTWTVTDNSGNESTAIQTVTVTDNEGPVPTQLQLQNATGECSVTVTSVPTAIDNFSGVVNGTTSDPLSYTEQGTYVITWNFEDANGNTSTQDQVVIVKDITKPVPTITNLPAITGQQCSINLTIPTATDNCAGLITATPISYYDLNIIGSYVIVWEFNDGNGNIKTQNQTVTVTKDIIAPIPTLSTLPTINEACSATVTTVPTAQDNCSGLIYATTTSPLAYPNQGRYTIVWTYTDANGNKSTQNQSIVIKDAVAPIPDIATLPTINGLCNATITAPTAMDNCKGLIIGTTTSPLSYTTQGTRTITWTYNDGNGNTSTQLQTVIVKDNIAPVPTISILPTISGKCSASVTAPTAQDNCKGLITGTTTSPLNYTTQGTRTINWTYNDGNGNTSTQSQTVIVKDDVPPVPNAVSLPTITGVCSVSVTTKPTATDNCKGTITATTTNPLTYTTQGTYTIVWSFSDGNGNTTTQTQTVIVQDLIAPIPNVAALTTLTGQCSITVTARPTATDNCKGTITATTTNPLSYTTQGTYTIVWNYNDGNGNITTQNQTVIVQDNTLPVVKTKAVTITLVNGIATLTATQVDNGSTDNCGIQLREVSKSTFTCANIGSNIVTLKITDKAGNISSANATVTVAGTIPTISIASIPTNTTYTGGISTNLYIGYGAQSTTLKATLPTTGAPYTYTWTGNNLNMLSNTTSSNPIFTPTAAGSYLYTLTATNKYGCSVSSSITICVTDIRVTPTVGSNVYVCHLTTGPTPVSQTLQVPVNQVATYVNTKSTDKLGSCGQILCAASAFTTASIPRITTTEQSAHNFISEEMNIVVMSNPTTTYFTFKIETKKSLPVQLKVIDAFGRILEVNPNIKTNELHQIGHRYSNGAYFMELKQGTNRKIIKLIKG